jgi:hypothetical protein
MHSEDSAGMFWVQESSPTRGVGARISNLLSEQFTGIHAGDIEWILKVLTKI